MNKFFLTICTVLLVSFSSNAQETVVKGKVLDTNSSEPIPDATVSIMNSIFSTMTDAEGTFSFTQQTLPRGEHVLEISKPGYISLQLPVTIQDGMVVDLQPILMAVDL